MYLVCSFAGVVHEGAGQVVKTVTVMQDQLQQKALLQALHLLLTLRKLDSSIPQDPESQLQLLSTGVSLLVDAGILGLFGGLFLKTCLAALAPHFAGDPCATVWWNAVATHARHLMLHAQLACVTTTTSAALSTI